MLLKIYPYGKVKLLCGNPGFSSLFLFRERTGCGIPIMFITGRFCNRQRTASPENMGRKTAFPVAVSLYGNYPHASTRFSAGRAGLSIDRPGCLCGLFLNRIFDKMLDTH